MRALAITGMVTAALMPSIIDGSLMRATPPSRRMSAGTRSSAITATAPASSAILACSGVTTSMMTPPRSISARPRLTRSVPVCRSMNASLGVAALLNDGLRTQRLELDPGDAGRHADGGAGRVGELHLGVGRRLGPPALDHLTLRQHPRLARTDDLRDRDGLADGVHVAGADRVRHEPNDDVGRRHACPALDDLGRAVAHAG